MKFENISAGSGDFAAPLPVYNNDQIASYVRSGYWNGTDYRWNTGSSGTAPQFGTLTYNIDGLNAQGAFLADQAFAIYETLLGIDFVRVSSTADINFNDDAAGAFANFSASGGIITSASVNVSTGWLATYGAGLNSYSFQTYLHEIGHALGLGHGGNYNGSGNYVTDTTDPNYGNNSNHYINDSWQATMMSYFSQSENTYIDASYAYLISPMTADLIALAGKYGLNASAFAGNTIWGFNTNITTTSFASLASLADRTAFTIMDSGGEDTLDFSGYLASQRINLGAETVSDIGGLRGNMAIARGTQIEHAIGGAGNDTIVGNAAANVLNGNGGSDTLNGLGGSDVLDGGDGDDVLLTGGGSDQAFGGAGNDTVYWGPPIPAVSDARYHDGGVGQDTINGGGVFFGAVRFDLAAGTYNNGSTFTETWTNFENYWNETGAGDEAVWGNNSANVISTGGGTNELRGEGGADRLFAGGGGDLLFGGEGADNCVGHAGADQLFGAGGVDMLRGGADGDQLTGGLEADRLYGGGGGDAFVFLALSDSRSGTMDQLLAGDGGAAFDGAGTVAGDWIDVSAIDANSTVSGNQAFVFGGTGIGRLTCIGSGSNTRVAANVDRDTEFEFQLEILDGTVALSKYTASDFVL